MSPVAVTGSVREYQGSISLCTLAERWHSPSLAPRQGSGAFLGTLTHVRTMCWRGVACAPRAEPSSRGMARQRVCIDRLTIETPSSSWSTTIFLSWRKQLCAHSSESYGGESVVVPSSYTHVTRTMAQEYVLYNAPRHIYTAVWNSNGRGDDCHHNSPIWHITDSPCILVCQVPCRMDRLVL